MRPKHLLTLQINETKLIKFKNIFKSLQKEKR